jgi:hypothetical protein
MADTLTRVIGPATAAELRDGATFVVNGHVIIVETIMVTGDLLTIYGTEAGHVRVFRLGDDAPVTIIG